MPDTPRSYRHGHGAMTARSHAGPAHHLADRGRSVGMFEHVDPFIGTDLTSLPPQSGLAATWWAPKPQVGDTHPGATYPFGMVSACAYSGAYPTGYGLYQLNTEGVPSELYDEQTASGFTHFQQSGT